MSEKIKEIKKLLDIVKVTDWSQIGDRIDEIKLMFDGLEKPKRKPLSDDSLPLTKEEFEELRRFTGIGTETVVLVEYIPNQFIWVTYSSGREEILDNVEAILYLAERFELIKED